MTLIITKSNVNKMVDSVSSYNQYLPNELKVKGVKSIEYQKINLISDSVNRTLLLSKKIEEHRKKIHLSENDLTQVKFYYGGVNKDKNTNLGILHAKNKTGTRDFLKEQKISRYCDSKPILSSVVSLQTQDGLPESFVNKNFATFSVYDDQIKSEMLSEVLASGLSMEQAKFLSCQLIDILKIFYMNKVSHNDLHKDNILILKEKGQEQKELLMKVIDFGRAKIDSEFDNVRFNDINYVFFNKGISILETTARNIFTPVAASMNYGPALKIKQKHKPLHDIIKSCCNTKVNIDKELSIIGSKLKHTLSAESEQYQAFDDAKMRVCQLISRVFGLNE
ncbi:Protein kinase domain-containing protein [Vibrio parahaemolyticus]|uniref:protein kinase domain-containing protein n=1 Tax=Vibrio parahaemolyticus TaxID=670 RepID=UPI00320CCBD1